MTHGKRDNIQFYLNLSKEKGYLMGPLQEMPSLMQHLQPVMDAFNLLSNSRPLGFGAMGPLSFSTVLDYLEWYGIEGRDEQERWMRLLRHLDDAYLNLVNKPAT